jgi:hypothetical protein
MMRRVGGGMPGLGGRAAAPEEGFRRPPPRDAAGTPPAAVPDDLINEITVEAKRLPSDDGVQNPTGLTLTYEATHGLRTANLWAVPGDNKWHTHTWKVTDARFTAKLGWHFLLDASGTGHDVLIREVKIGR